MAPMAEPPILTLTEAGLGFGGSALFEGVSLAVRPGERIALVGRNGSGKSTLLKLMAGRVEPDTGGRFLQPGLVVGLMEQEPDFAGHATLFAFAAAGIDLAEHHRVEAAFEGIGLAPDLAPAAASGGERRRAALARLLAPRRPLWLLDEPETGLDARSRARLATVLQDHLDGGGMAVVASHGALGIEGIRVLELEEPG
jgi:ABC transport system ATP-binding/permease protein